MGATVLCAVDDSGAAGRVLDTACWLADALHERLVVVHVVPGSARDGDDLVASVRARLGDEQAEVRVVSGSPAEAVRDTVDEEDAAFLVVGSRGQGSLGAAVLGSVSRALAAEARCPVVVVPSVEPWAVADGAAYASVVCGVDGSDEAVAGAVFADRLAKRLGWRLVVVHARQNVRAMASGVVGQARLRRCLSLSPIARPGG
jgi:nucleotide-binding universal stress UspA family protein